MSPRLYLGPPSSSETTVKSFIFFEMHDSRGKNIPYMRCGCYESCVKLIDILLFYINDHTFHVHDCRIVFLRLTMHSLLWRKFWRLVQLVCVSSASVTICTCQQVDTSICGLSQSPQGLALTMHTTMAKALAKNFAMVQFSYKLLRLLNKGKAWRNFAQLMYYVVLWRQRRYCGDCDWRYALIPW